MKNFNINEFMYIQISSNGWDHLKRTHGDEYIAACIKHREIIIDNEIWYKLQCHQVFDLFPINFGGQPFFNTNVLIDDKALTDK